MLEAVNPDSNFVQFQRSQIKEPLPKKNLELGPLESPPSKVDRATLQKELSALKLQSRTTQENKPLIDEFIRIKTNGTLQDQLSLLNNANPVQVYGKETWVIGLVGMMYGAHGLSESLVEALILQLGRFLTDENAYFVVSILRAIDDKAQAGVINDSAKQFIIQNFLSTEFISYVLSERVDSFTRQQLITLVTEILTHLDQKPVLNQFLTLVGHVEPQRQQYIPQHFDESLLHSHMASIESAIMAYSLFDKALLGSFLGSSIGIVYALINLVDLEAYVYRRLVRHKFSQVAIVTDHPMMEAFQQFEHIHIIERDPVQPIKMFYNKYKKLLETRYGMIYVFTADSHFWTSYHYASEAAGKMYKQIRVIDTKTFGLGLGVLIQEASRLLYRDHVDLETFENKLAVLIHSLRYWVIPSSTTHIRERYWFKNMLRHRANKKPISKRAVPLLEFHEPIGLIGIGKTKEAVISEMEKRVLLAKKELPFPPKRVVIVYKSLHKEALYLANHLCELMDGIEVTVIPAGSFLSAQFHDHVGCVLI